MNTFEENNATQRADNTSVSLEDFRILKVLGKGFSGKVFLVVKNGGIDDGTYYAMKSMKKVLPRKFDVAQINVERDVLANSTDPFVAKLIYAFQTEERAYLVLEFFQGGDLYNRLQKTKKFNVLETRFYVAEIILAIKHIHEMGMIYRDLKPENVLIGNDGHIVLTDFGLSGFNNRSNELCGTLEFMAPEIFSREPQTTAVDWWSLGIVMHTMLTGKSVFRGNDKKDLIKKITKKDPEISRWIRPDARSLIRKLLDKDPKMRLGSGDVSEIMDHKFFKTVNWEQIKVKEVQAPFEPTFWGPMDLQNFEQEFTSSDTKVSKCKSADEETQTLFKEFNFTHPSLSESSTVCRTRF